MLFFQLSSKPCYALLKYDGVLAHRHMKKVLSYSYGGYKQIHTRPRILDMGVRKVSSVTRVAVSQTNSKRVVQRTPLVAPSLKLITGKHFFTTSAIESPLSRRTLIFTSALVSDLKRLLQSLLISMHSPLVGSSFERHAHLYNAPMIIAPEVSEEKLRINVSVLYSRDSTKAEKHILKCFPHVEEKKDAFESETGKYIYHGFTDSDNEKWKTLSFSAVYDVNGLDPSVVLQSVRDATCVLSSDANVPMECQATQSEMSTVVRSQTSSVEEEKNEHVTHPGNAVPQAVPLLSDLHAVVACSPTLTADYADAVHGLSKPLELEKRETLLNYFRYPPHRSGASVLRFSVQFLLNYRFYLIFMARTMFQALRPLLAFCVFGEIMKVALGVMNSGIVFFLFSFVLAFEVLYFFLQCYISYVFLGMFFTAAF